MGGLLFQYHNHQKIKKLFCCCSCSVFIVWLSLQLSVTSVINPNPLVFSLVSPHGRYWRRSKEVGSSDAGWMLDNCHDWCCWYPQYSWPCWEGKSVWTCWCSREASRFDKLPRWGSLCPSFVTSELLISLIFRWDRLRCIEPHPIITSPLSRLCWAEARIRTFGMRWDVVKKHTLYIAVSYWLNI